jgi:hypothetical protein
MLWDRMHDAQKAFLEARAVEKELFQTNASAPHGEMRVSSERRKAQIEIVRRAFIEWQDAVDRYLAALKS